MTTATDTTVSALEAGDVFYYDTATTAYDLTGARPPRPVVDRDHYIVLEVGATGPAMHSAEDRTELVLCRPDTYYRTRRTGSRTPRRHLWLEPTRPITIIGHEEI